MAKKNLTKSKPAATRKPNYVDTSVDASFALQAARNEIDDGSHKVEVGHYLGHSKRFIELLASFEERVGRKAFKPISQILAPQVEDLDQAGQKAVDDIYNQTFPFRSLMAAVFIAGEEYERARKSINDWRVVE